MPVINEVTPHSSVRSGNIPIDIIGSGFLTSDLSKSFSDPAFYTFLTQGNGSVSMPSSNGIELSVSNVPGDYAAVSMDDQFNKVFGVSVTVDQNILTFPSVDDARIFALRAEDAANPQTYFDIHIGYRDSTGYYARVEAWVMNSLVYSGERSIGPYQIDALKIVRAEERMLGYIQIGSDWIFIDDYLGFSDFTSTISSYIQNSSTHIAGEFGVFLSEFNVDTVVSLVSQPATLVSVDPNLIQVISQPNEVGAGNVLAGFPDGSYTQWSGSFTYTQGEAVTQVSHNIDMAIAVYQSYINPSRNELFTASGGFTWDEDEFIAETKKNENLFMPSLWDPKLANIPPQAFQSGHGFDESIKLIDIKKIKQQGEEDWYARLNHGTYFIKSIPYYLYSDESVIRQLGKLTTQDGRSIQPLLYAPKYGIPISASTLTTDVRSGNIVDDVRFSKVVKFTGKASNGVELDTSDPANIDKAFREFKVNYNPNNMFVDWRVPVNNANSGLYSFFLPEIPLFEFPVIFTRKDIFQNRKFVAKNYGDPDAIFGQFPYGTGPEQPGDYTIDYVTGEVVVWLDQDYVDLGYMTWTFDYPAVIEFNDNYLKQKGGGVSSPTTSDLSDLDLLGESNAQPAQEFIVSEFPIYDETTNTFLDRQNFSLYTYDASTLTFDTSWERVQRDSLNEYGPNDKIYIVEADTGKVVFGDGINGAIPTKYHRVYAVYSSTLRIEYEPQVSVDYWTGKSVDLNLSKNNLNSGFLYLTRREQIPDTIRLEFANTEINALQFTALTATVIDVDGEPIVDIPVEFNILNQGGSTEDDIVVSNSNGQSSTIFLPNASIESLGNFIQVFEPGADEDTKGDYIADSYQNNGVVANAKILAEEEIVDDPSGVYVFKILDANDAFTPYNNETRKGGVYQVYYKENTITGDNELVRPSGIQGRVVTFDEPLPQSHDPLGPNYDPRIRGLVFVGKKLIQARAKIQFDNVVIESDTATLRVGYSPIQKGEWTLPIFPTTFTGSEIDRATYITINP